MWTLDALRARREEILSIAARRGAASVRVFGSAARGDAGPDSDVDLLVDFAPGTSLMDHGELILDLEELLGCRVDVVSARADLRDRMRRRVEADAVAL
jgi:uncharacterized protein